MKHSFNKWAEAGTWSFLICTKLKLFWSLARLFFKIKVFVPLHVGIFSLRTPLLKPAIVTKTAKTVVNWC